MREWLRILRIARAVRLGKVAKFGGTLITEIRTAPRPIARQQHAGPLILRSERRSDQVCAAGPLCMLAVFTILSISLRPSIQSLVCLQRRRQIELNEAVERVTPSIVCPCYIPTVFFDRYGFYDMRPFARFGAAPPEINAKPSDFI